MISGVDADLFAADEPGPDDAFQVSQRQELLGECLEALTIPQQRLLYLRYECEQTFDEIGAENGVSGPAACQMHTRAIDALRRKFEMRAVSKLQDLI